MEYRINIMPEKLEIDHLHKAIRENKISEKDLIIVDGCSSQNEFYQVIDYISNTWAKCALQFQIGLSDKGLKFYGGSD